MFERFRKLLLIYRETTTDNLRWCYHDPNTYLENNLKHTGMPQGYVVAPVFNILINSSEREEEEVKMCLRHKLVWVGQNEKGLVAYPRETCPSRVTR